MQRRLLRLWGGAQAVLARAQQFSWVDLLALVAFAGLLFGVVTLARQWGGPHQALVEIDLSPWALPLYTFFSLARGLIAYALSLAFTLVYGFWAAKDRVAERGLVPLLDILQSIPVLAFMPGVVRGLTGLVPESNVGLELACVLMIFTGQAWNMTFSFYHSLRSIPPELSEAGTVYHFSWWQRLRWIELPFSTMGLVWNSMMSMAGGWFFLMITEAFQLGSEDYRLPGLGSYMTVAFRNGDAAGMCWGIFAMVAMIVAVDQLLWRPVIVWAQKYRVEEGGYQEEMSSWFLGLLRRSRLPALLAGLRARLLPDGHAAPAAPAPPKTAASRLELAWAGVVSLGAFLALLAGLAYGAWQLVGLLLGVPPAEWADIGKAAFWTFGRVMLAVALGTLWALPAGLAIGLSPRLSRLLQPVIQVVASFPAPMLFPVVIAVLEPAGVTLDWGSVVLMLMGTQWYILFNVIAGAMAIPADLKEAARSYRMGRWQRFRILYAPAVFPYLVTGWVTAAGGAWNTSIVAEYFKLPGRVLEAEGLGDRITRATEADNAAALAASILVMSLVVVLFNRIVWKRLYRLAEERYALAK